jgi:hypothetical protein
MTLVHDTASVVRHAGHYRSCMSKACTPEEGERVPGVEWNGTLIEQLELVAAVERNCECKFDSVGMRLGACSAHAMLVRDQRALDGLLWSRRLAKRRLAEEGISAP